MNPVRRLLSEYSGLAQTLSPWNFACLLKETALNAPSIIRTRTLTALDAAMSRDMVIRFGDSRLVVPIRRMDQILAALRDNPSFGNVREMYARDCYLRHLNLTPPLRAVLDLGANRGMFSLLALVHFRAEIAVGVEPVLLYDQVFQLLMKANHRPMQSGPRYGKLIGSPSTECSEGGKYVSISSIMREQSIERFNLVKIDIEGGEKDLFSEPDWLSSVDNVTMELHPQFVGDLSLIPAALEKHGFTYRLMDQEGGTAGIDSAMFLVASCSGGVSQK